MTIEQLEKGEELVKEIRDSRGALTVCKNAIEMNLCLFLSIAGMANGQVFPKSALVLVKELLTDHIEELTVKLSDL
jgi:hypothetical protein